MQNRAPSGFSSWQEWQRIEINRGEQIRSPRLAPTDQSAAFLLETPAVNSGCKMTFAELRTTWGRSGWRCSEDTRIGPILAGAGIGEEAAGLLVDEGKGDLRRLPRA